MLKIFNDLAHFFEDNYRRINVREYARIQHISPPTASKLLEDYHKEGLLRKEEEKNYILYFANKESDVFIDLQRIYWYLQIKKSGLLDLLEQELVAPLIILFGSLSKAEAKDDSDVDLAIFTASKKEMRIDKFEKLMKRKIQLFVFKERSSVDHRELLNNILNGYKLSGNW